jgi:hypothetical protein
MRVTTRFMASAGRGALNWPSTPVDCTVTDLIGGGTMEAVP